MAATPIENKKIQTTNLLAKILEDIGQQQFNFDNDEIDFLAKLRINPDLDKYEKKEREIPELIYDILKKESNAFTKLVKRNYFEEDAWLVSIEQKESEYLEENEHEIYSQNEACFVKIHVPKIFIRTLSMPMILRNH